MRRARVPVTIFLALAGLAFFFGAGSSGHAAEKADPEAYRSYDVGGGLVTLRILQPILSILFGAGRDSPPGARGARHCPQALINSHFLRAAPCVRK